MRSDHVDSQNIADLLSAACKHYMNDKLLFKNTHHVVAEGVHEVISGLYLLSDNKDYRNFFVVATIMALRSYLEERGSVKFLGGIKNISIVDQQKKYNAGALDSFSQEIKIELRALILCQSSEPLSNLFYQIPVGTWKNGVGEGSDIMDETPIGELLAAAADAFHKDLNDDPLDDDGDRCIELQTPSPGAD